MFNENYCSQNPASCFSLILKTELLSEGRGFVEKCEGVKRRKRLMDTGNSMVITRRKWDMRAGRRGQRGDKQ